jgi:DNA-directed RNA polymerase subunit beta
MQSLALDVRVLTEDNEEIQIKEVSEYEETSGIDGIMNVDTTLEESEEALFAEGFTEESADDDFEGRL